MTGVPQIVFEMGGEERRCSVCETVLGAQDVIGLCLRPEPHEQHGQIIETPEVFLLAVCPDCFHPQSLNTSILLKDQLLDTAGRVWDELERIAAAQSGTSNLPLNEISHSINSSVIDRFLAAIRDMAREIDID